MRRCPGAIAHNNETDEHSACLLYTSSENYAAFWDKNNGKTRAKLAREAGASRVKSAEMAFNNVDASKIDAYNDQQASLRKAQKAYFSEAKEDVSPQDLASLKSSLTPKLEKMGSDLMALVQSVTNIQMCIRDRWNVHHQGNVHFWLSASRGDVYKRQG